MKRYLQKCLHCGKDREIHVDIFGDVLYRKKCWCQLKETIWRWSAASLVVGGFAYLAWR